MLFLNGRHARVSYGCMVKQTGEMACVIIRSVGRPGSRSPPWAFIFLSLPGRYCFLLILPLLHVRWSMVDGRCPSISIRDSSTGMRERTASQEVMVLFFSSSSSPFPSPFHFPPILGPNPILLFLPLICFPMWNLRCCPDLDAQASAVKHPRKISPFSLSVPCKVHPLSHSRPLLILQSFFLLLRIITAHSKRT
jgi:hypothetical protein